MTCDRCPHKGKDVVARCRLDGILYRHLYLCENCWQGVVLAFGSKVK